MGVGKVFVVSVCSMLLLLLLVLFLVCGGMCVSLLFVCVLRGVGGGLFYSF